MPASTLRILGIDPGLNRTGFGVVDVLGGRTRHVASGVVRVPAGALPDRLRTILIEISAVIRAHTPTLAVVEQVFVNVNPKATLLLGQARGAAICAAVGAGLPVHEYSALQIKQAVVGYGKADKSQVQAMVMQLLALQSRPVADAADALACALTHAHSAPLARALGAQARALGLPTAHRGAARGGRGRRAWTALVADAAK